MFRMALRMPLVPFSSPRLGACPSCGGRLIRHQTTVRGLTDLRLRAVTVQRCRCKGCGKTCTLRPPGASRSSKSDRLRAAAVLLYCLGLSYDACSAALKAVGAPVSKTTIHDYRRQAGEAAVRLHKSARQGGLRWAGQGSSFFNDRGRRRIVSFVADALSGRPVHIEFVHGEDAAGLKACLQKAAGPELELVVSADARTYKPAADVSGAQHKPLLA